MLINFRTRIRPARILNHPHGPVPIFAETLKMATTVPEVKSQRPICPFCSKPTRICLCNRLQYPALENSVSVTILQHSLEKNHPLNSTRIARLGLKNVTVATVCDVNFEARFDIRLIERVHEAGLGGIGLGRRGFDKDLNFVGTKKVGFERRNVGGFEFERLKKCVEEEKSSFVGGSEEENGLKGWNFGGNLDLLECDCDFLVSKQEDASSGERCEGENGLQLGSRFNKPLVSVSLCKYGVIDDCQKPNFDRILGCEEVLNVLLSKGFAVKRMQKQRLRLKVELEEYEEFELEVPPGSVLLFPSEDAVGVDELEAMDFEVKNLIVLDGTWPKAKRIYKENPWLKLLPHLKLDLDKMSLYSEVRQQPKAGYLSTIESIVYALKALGDNSEGLDNLLDVFESMVGDQRRCKDERLSKMPPA